MTDLGERDAATAQRDAAIAERDARPTTEALVTVQGERDAILADIQLAYDEVTGQEGAAEQDLLAVAHQPPALQSLISFGPIPGNLMIRSR